MHAQETLSFELIVGVLFLLISVTASPNHLISGRCYSSSTILFVMMLLCASLAMTRGTIHFDVPASARSLASAQKLVRNEILQRQREADVDGATLRCEDIEVRLGGGHHHSVGLTLSELDAGSPGCFKVIWSGAADGSTVVDGGLNITTPWKLVDATTGLYSTIAPAALVKPTILPIRTMYVNDMRYNRTRDSPATLAILGSQRSKITKNGYDTSSSIPLTWTDLTTVELVKQGAFTQMRCPLSSVTALAPAPKPTPSKPGECAFSQKREGRSPGSTFLGINNVSTYAECQAECCQREHATPTACKGVMYKDSRQLCYLVARDPLVGFQPCEGCGFIGTMNPPPITYRSEINVSAQCYSTMKSYKYGTQGYPDYLENTGNFSNLGEFYLDRKKGLLLATFLPEHRPTTTKTTVNAVVGLQETLLEVKDTHDVEWHNVGFTHTAWTQANGAGYVERFSNVYFNFNKSLPQGLANPAAAVLVQRSHNVVFDSCSFQRLGAWAMRIQNESQDVEVRHCTFSDLSGGAVMLGSPQENVAVPAKQLSRITITDNTMTHLSVEYHGAAAVHSMVVSNSTLAHNLISDIGYCGISWNWPATQGPTFPYPPTNPELGYNMNNVVANNDVSHFMRDTSDGGGIHSVGYGGNTLYEGNYFHDMLRPAVSILYIDNWGAGFTLNDNVVDNCPNTAMGYYYFQSIAGCPAHDTSANGLWARNSGDPTKTGLKCNCTNVVNVPNGSAWPAGAQAIISNSGPRSKESKEPKRPPPQLPFLRKTAAPAQCGAGITTACPKLEDCCASEYSPTKFGCTVSIDNALWVESQGCGDGLPSDGKLNTTVCCKPGPGLAPSTTLKNVLIIGDSVSIGYTTIATKNVVKLLSSTVQVQHGPWDVSDGGAKDTAMGVACLDRWLMTQSQQAVKWDAITFNFGLHDMDNSSRCEGLYREQLTNITKRLAALGTKIIFVDTTPFMPRRAIGSTVVEDMNAIAKTIVSPYIAVPIVDLYGYVTKTCGKLYTDCPICAVHPCTFHYDDVGMNAQAAMFAAAIESALSLP